MAENHLSKNDTIQEPINKDLTSIQVRTGHDNPGICRPSCFVLAALVIIVVTVVATVATVVPLSLNRSQPTTTVSGTTQVMKTTTVSGTTQAPIGICKCLFHKNMSGLFHKSV